MDIQKVNRLFAETAYIRTGGSPEELKCAEYLKEECAKLGGEAYLESFEVDMATVKKAKLIIDGEEIPCTGYFLVGTHDVEGPFYYLTNTDAYSLSECKGKIVLFDGYVGYWKYQDILEAGAVGFITHDGNINFVDEDIDQREVRAQIHRGNKIPGVHINTKKAVELVAKGVKNARIELEQDEYPGTSHNVILDLPGECPEYIALTAHYDSMPLSQGAYDNMSGCVGLLGLVKRFAKKPHKYGLRFIWCGSEERGLLGSKAYVSAHEEELGDIVLNVNLDMIGSIMGNFIACCTTDEKVVHYLQYLGQIEGFGIKAYQDVYSSDSTPFADKGVPAISFARIAPGNTESHHNAYDTAKQLSASQMLADIEFIGTFVENMVNAEKLPIARELPDNVKEKLDYYMCRKRNPNTL